VKLPNEVVKAAARTGAEDSRRSTVVPAPAAVDPELSKRPHRRRFTGPEKLRILAEIDRASRSGGIGSILRREGLYWSTLSRWREQRAAGMVKGLTPAKRGPRAAKPSPEAVELAQLRREHTRLQQRLDRAEAIIDLQK
jgi:transposase